MTARVGRMLGIAVCVCFLTGLVSHLHQHPISWLPLPPSPSWGYQVTQGAHVAFGIGCIPLVLVKLFSVYPLLLQWPPVRGLKHGLERLSVAILVSCMLFEVTTGMLNTEQWYPWRFFFPAAHYAVAWALVGSIMLHLAVKADVIRDALRARLDDQRDVPDDPNGLSRRGLLLTTVGAVGAVTLVTIGQTLPGLGRIALLAPRRPDIGPQGMPVNRTATAAAVGPLASAGSWRLEVARNL